MLQCSNIKPVNALYEYNLHGKYRFSSLGCQDDKIIKKTFCITVNSSSVALAISLYPQHSVRHSRNKMQCSIIANRMYLQSLINTDGHYLKTVCPESKIPQSLFCNKNTYICTLYSSTP